MKNGRMMNVKSERLMRIVAAVTESRESGVANRRSTREMFDSVGLKQWSGSLKRKGKR